MATKRPKRPKTGKLIMVKAYIRRSASGKAKIVQPHFSHAKPKKRK